MSDLELEQPIPRDTNVVAFKRLQGSSTFSGFRAQPRTDDVVPLVHSQNENFRIESHVTEDTRSGEYGISKIQVHLKALNGRVEITSPDGSDIDPEIVAKLDNRLIAIDVSNEKYLLRALELLHREDGLTFDLYLGPGSDKPVSLEHLSVLRRDQLSRTENRDIADPINRKDTLTGCRTLQALQTSDSVKEVNTRIKGRKLLVSLDFNNMGLADKYGMGKELEIVLKEMKLAARQTLGAQGTNSYEIFRTGGDEFTIILRDNGKQTIRLLRQFEIRMNEIRNRYFSNTSKDPRLLAAKKEAHLKRAVEKVLNAYNTRIRDEATSRAREKTLGFDSLSLNEREGLIRNELKEFPFKESSLRRFVAEELLGESLPEEHATSLISSAGSFGMLLLGKLLEDRYISVLAFFSNNEHVETEDLVLRAAKKLYVPKKQRTSHVMTFTSSRPVEIGFDPSVADMQIALSLADRSVNSGKHANSMNTRREQFNPNFVLRESQRKRIYSAEETQAEFKKMTFPEHMSPVFNFPLTDAIEHSHKLRVSSVDPSLNGRMLRFPAVMNSTLSELALITEPTTFHMYHLDIPGFGVLNKVYSAERADEIFKDVVVKAEEELGPEVEIRVNGGGFYVLSRKPTTEIELRNLQQRIEQHLRSNIDDKAKVIHRLKQAVKTDCGRLESREELGTLSIKSARVTAKPSADLIELVEEFEEIAA